MAGENFSEENNSRQTLLKHWASKANIGEVQTGYSTPARTTHSSLGKPKGAQVSSPHHY